MKKFCARRECFFVTTLIIVRLFYGVRHTTFNIKKKKYIRRFLVILFFVMSSQFAFGQSSQPFYQEEPLTLEELQAQREQRLKEQAIREQRLKEKKAEKMAKKEMKAKEKAKKRKEKEMKKKEKVGKK